MLRLGLDTERLALAEHDTAPASPERRHHLGSYGRCAVVSLLAEQIATRFGDEAPVPCGVKEDPRKRSEIFEKHVVGPWIDEHADALAAAMNAALADPVLSAALAGIVVEDVRTTGSRSPLDVAIDLRVGQERFSVEANLKYGSAKSKDNVAGETSLFGYGVAGDRHLDIVRAKHLLETGLAEGDGYIVAHVTPSATAMVDDVTVFDVLATDPRSAGYHMNRQNGVQVNVRRAAEEYLRSADQLEQRDFCRDAERLIAWSIVSELDSIVERLATLLSALLKPTACQRLVGALRRAVSRARPAPHPAEAPGA